MSSDNQSASPGPSANGGAGSGDSTGNGQVLPQQIAELAGELSEAPEQDRSLRQRLARQIPDLAARSGQAAWQGVQAGKDTAWHGLQAGTGAAARRVRPVTDVAARNAQTGRDVATRGAQAGAGVARKGAQAGGGYALRGLRAGGLWLTTQAVEMAPKIPIRTIATLRQQYPGQETEQLADTLIEGATRASAGIGAAVGAAAAVPFVPTIPLELGVETLALVAIELKLIAELHEVYGMPAPGSGPQRMMAYLGAWTERRGVRVTANGLALVAGSPLRRQLERRLLAKASQSALSLAPLLAGAAAGALVDRRETRKLGTLVREDLRKRSTEHLPVR
jgi:hypothetical protein